MADERPVPTAEFEEALAGLDAEALAAFVGELRSVAGEQVAVEGPVVIVGTGDDRVRLHAIPAGGSLPADTADVDALVTTDPGTLAAAAADHRVIGPASLRQRLLYGLDSQAADRLCRRVLGMPARSAHYAPAGSGESAGDDATRAGTGSAGDGQSRDGGEQTEGGRRPAGEEGPAGEGGPPAGPGRTATAPGSGHGGGTEGPSTPGERATPASLTDNPWLVVAAVALLALAAGGGAALVADAGFGGDGTAAGGEGVDRDDGADGTEMNPPTDGGRPAPVPEDTSTATPADDPSVTAGPTPAASPADAGGPDGSGDGTLGSERYADPVPTCNRSYLHVVQIQMNALKYNDNATDDGIRTVRRFASPDNREIVGSFEQFVGIIESPTYAPMLSYDSAAFEPERTGEDTALVRVTTRVSGNVTARYEFRLTRQGEGQYDGCWMTDGVQPLDAGA